MIPMSRWRCSVHLRVRRIGIVRDGGPHAQRCHPEGVRPSGGHRRRHSHRWRGRGRRRVRAQRWRLVPVDPPYGRTKRPEIRASVDIALIGAPTQWVVSGDPYADAAFVFHRSRSSGPEVPTGWSQTTELVGSGVSAFEMFGESVAVDEDDALVSAPGDGDNPSGQVEFTFSGCRVTVTSTGEITATPIDDSRPTQIIQQ